MISFACITDDPVSRYGIDHFIRTTGLSVKCPSTSDTGVCIGYGAEGKGFFPVTVVQNMSLENGAGEISAYNQKYPLFQVPIDTSNFGSDCIAEFKSDTETYPCISKSPSGILIGFDIFRLTGSLLSGYMDTLKTHSNDIRNNSVFSPPLVDFYEDILFRAILAGCGEIGLPLIRKSCWPSGKKFAVCLTHDVDEFSKTYQWVTRPVKMIMRGDFSGLKNQMKSLSRKLNGQEPYWTFEDIMEKENSMGVHSTYFFLKESGEKSLLRPESWHLYGRNHSYNDPRIIALIQKLSEMGHEIGVHGSTFSYENLELLNHEKDEVEELLGKNVIGIRQHRLNLMVPVTWEYQSEAGLLYDTTLGNKTPDETAFRWGTCFPFHPRGLTGMLPLLEIPLSLMDIALQNGDDGWNVCSSSIEQVKNWGGVLTLLWHPAVFNDMEYPGLGEWYWKIIQECKKDDAWITTGQEIASWWKMREMDEFDWRCTEDELLVMGDFRNGCSFDLYLPENKTAVLISKDASLFECKTDRYLLSTESKNVVNEIVVGLR